MLGVEEVGVVGALVRDGDGKVAASPNGTPVSGCLVTPLSSTEIVDRGREATDDLVRVQLPITTGITRDSILVVRGHRYQIEGDPTPFIAEDDPDLSGYDVIGYRRRG